MIDAVEVMEVKKNRLLDNAVEAEKLREDLQAQGTYYVNLMSSPGSGKTTTLLSTIERLRDKLQIGIMEADIDSDVDAKTIQNVGIPAIQLHTGGMCHLDADMSRQGLDKLGIENLDLVVLENVGNLVCPAEFDSGAQLKVVILSIAEGHDKPLKYPLMFEECDAVLINKIDAAPIFDFDFEKCREYVEMRHPGAVVFPISAKTGEGMDAWCDWLYDRVKSFQNSTEEL